MFIYILYTYNIWIWQRARCYPFSLETPRERKVALRQCIYAAN